MCKYSVVLASIYTSLVHNDLPMINMLHFISRWQLMQCREVILVMCRAMVNCNTYKNDDILIKRNNENLSILFYFIKFIRCVHDSSVEMHEPQNISKSLNSWSLLIFKYAGRKTK